MRLIDPSDSPPPAPEASDRELIQRYRELRALARRILVGERQPQTLAATDLAHEAWLRLSGREIQPGLPPAEFLRLAATVMRHILVDRARARASSKRGANGTKICLDALDLATEGSFADLLAVDEAIQKLRERDAGLAELVRLRFFAGLTMEETATALGTSVRTVNRDWKLAKALLAGLLQERG